MNEETEKKLNKIITEQGIQVSGNGIVITELNKLNATMEKMINALFHIETKLEALMDEDAKNRLEKLKSNFRR